MSRSVRPVEPTHDTPSFLPPGDRPPYRLIRRLFPQAVACPQCRSEEGTYSGSNDSGTMRHRRCATCGATFKVPYFAEEVKRPAAAQSEILLRDGR